MTTTLNRLASIIDSDAFGSLGARQLRVLLVVLAHANGETGMAWPSTSRIAQMAGVDQRDARRALRELIDLGLLQVAEVARSRRSRRLVVAPVATDHSLRRLLRAGGDSPRASGFEGVGSPLANEGGDSPRADSFARGESPFEGGDSPPFEGGGSPPRTGKEQGTEPGGVASLAGDQSRALEMIAERRMQSGNPFRGRIRVAGFLEAGGTLADLRRLCSEAKGRAGLLWTWLADPYAWRGVLDDRALRIREAQHRRRAAPSERAIG